MARGRLESEFLMRNESPQVLSGALQITPSERRVLQLLASGHTTNDVAVCLGISMLETEELLTMLFAAIGAAGQAEAIAVADRRGLLT